MRACSVAATVGCRPPTRSSQSPPSPLCLSLRPATRLGRYELEKALVEGSIQVADLPQLWNQKMNEYLGCEPESDARGVLQDVHWSAGLFG